MNRDLVSSIIAFRAANFLIANYAIKFNSESLLRLDREMGPCSGHPSGDPALAQTWVNLWGGSDLRTPHQAAAIASDYIEREGARGDDDEHLRLADELRTSVKDAGSDMWQEWCHFLDHARDLADPRAWSF
jgi:hypothetical protein